MTNNTNRRNIALGPGREFDIVRTLLDEWGRAAERIGDDAAILEVPPGERVVVTTDTSVEDVHFKREWLNHFEIGYRATAASLSDLAAMGARPLGVVVALTLPVGDELGTRELATGIREGASAIMCPIVGGDLSSGASLSLTITALGSVAKPLTRSGARVGDKVYVTGVLGGPDAALRAWLSGKQPSERDRARFAAPVPRIEPAIGLATRGASSAIDISDGLVADARHLAAASNVTIEIDGERVPRVPGVTMQQAIASGEEYELIVTAKSIDAAAFSDEFGLELTEIGRVVAGPPRVILLENGREIAAPTGGFDHFETR